MSNKSIKIKDNDKDHYYSKDHYKGKSGNIESSNVTFFENAHEQSLLNESIKQLQFSYDDMEETKFNTNNKKNTISESRDQIAPKIMIDYEKLEGKDHDADKGIPLRKTNSKVIIFKEANEESNDSNAFGKAKTKQSQHKRDEIDNLITDNNLELNKMKLSSRREEQFQNLKPEGNFITNRVHSRSSFKLAYNNKILVENNIGSFLSNKLFIDVRGIEGGLRNKRDGQVHFGFDKMDSKGQSIINDVLVNSQQVFANNLEEGYKNQTLFSIFFDMNCQKFFFQPVKNKAKQVLKIYFNLVLPFHFISNQTFEMNSIIVTLEPNSKDNILGIKINHENVISITKSKTVCFINTSNGIELKLLPVPGDVSAICSLHYEKGKELWTLIPQSISIWLKVNCKQALEQSTLIKCANESIIKVTLIK